MMVRVINAGPEGRVLSCARPVNLQKEPKSLVGQSVTVCTLPRLVSTTRGSVHPSLLTFPRDRPTLVLYSPATFLQELFLHIHSASESFSSGMVLPTIKHDMNVSFSGCGFLGIYHIGVASCLKTYAPYLLENKLCGSSAGAISACCLLCDVPLGKCRCGFDRNVFRRRFFLSAYSLYQSTYLAQIQRVHL